MEALRTQSHTELSSLQRRDSHPDVMNRRPADGRKRDRRGGTYSGRFVGRVRDGCRCLVIVAGLARIAWVPGIAWVAGLARITRIAWIVWVTGVTVVLVLVTPAGVTPLAVSPPAMGPIRMGPLGVGVAPIGMTPFGCG